MKKIGIVPNPQRDKNFDTARELINYLESKNVLPVMERETAEKHGFGKYAVDDEELYSKSDLIIVLGGDGTMLSAGIKAMVYSTLLMGINLGHLGFLTDNDSDGMFESVDKVLKGQYRIERRMMVDAQLKTENDIKNYTALNEVGVYMGGVVDSAVYVNDEYIDNFYGDGILVSTPTGSTAYNLAAGGPILKADSNMIAITPICPHMLHARSIVVGAEDIVKINIKSFTNDSLKIVIDGKQVSNMEVGQTLTVRKSNYYTNIVKTNNLGFYDVLRNKMFGKGGR